MVTTPIIFLTNYVINTKYLYKNLFYLYNLILYKIIYRDLSLMVKYETFNLCVVGSNPTGLKLLLEYFAGYILA